ncbi:response regulator [Flavobacterium sp.]|uniref:response regulator n=1 Tax=Flavobacterium sp. TaxID=239 RepID=UPI0024893693|nr:response regulator [Flavobacterium sp.]MDI1317294.1 response regulator [Flavobacterium sp.]
MIPDTNPRFPIVMIIDDNTIDLYITSHVITRQNFGRQILQYSIASEALNYLIENSKNVSALPQIILVDIYMPIMSGFEFMEAYDDLPQSVKDYCNVYVVSSSIDQKDIMRAEEDKNIIGFCEKPISKITLENMTISN